MSRKGELIVEAKIKDQASVQAGKIADELEKAQNKIAGGDEKMAKSANAARLERQRALPVNQKLKFEMEKLAAAGDEVALATIQQKESFELAKREAKLYLKANEEIPPELQKQLEVTEDLAVETADYGAAAKKSFLAVGAAIGGAGLALGAMAVKFAANADAAIKDAERMGISVEQYTALDHALQISGTSMEEMKPAVTKLNKLIRDAAAGSGEAAKKFERVGVSATNADGSLKDVNQVMLEVADKFKEMPNGAQKSALAIDMFEESGTRMVQFLNAGSEGITQLTDEAAELGNVIGTKAARDSEVFNDNLTRLKGSFVGTSNTISSAMIPAFNSILDGTAKMSGGFRMNKEDAGAMVATFLEMGRMVGEVFLGIGLRIGNFFRGFDFIVHSVVGGALDKFAFLASFINDDLGMKAEQMGQKFAASADATGLAMAEAELKTQEQIQAFKDMIANAQDAAVTVNTTYVPAVKKAVVETANIGTAGKDAMKETSKAVEETADKVDVVFSKVKGMGKSLGQELRDEYKAIAEGLVTVLSAAGNAMGEAMANATEDQDAFTEGVKAMGKVFVNMLVDMTVAAISAAAVKSMVDAFAAHQFIPFAGYAIGAAAAATAGGFVKALMADVPEKMNRGGIVGGPNVNRDVVPILATPGEMIIPRDLTQEILRLGGQSTRGIGFNQGGVVRSSSGTGALVVNINEQQFIPRSPAELDKFVRDRVVPSLRRLQNRGAF